MFTKISHKIVLLTLAAALFAFGSIPGTAANTSDHGAATVDVFNFGYEDADTGTPVTSIHAGDSVTFVWSSGIHSVTHGLHPATDGATPPPATGAFDSGVFGPGHVFTATFGETGVFEYYCTVHPSMRGVVVVE